MSLTVIQIMYNHYRCCGNFCDNLNRRIVPGPGMAKSRDSHQKGSNARNRKYKNRDEEVDRADDVTEHKSTLGLYADKSWTFIKKLFLMKVG